MIVGAKNRLGGILDRIKAERERTAEGAQVNAVIGEGIEHIDALNDLLRQPVAASRAFTGIARLVGRAEEKPAGAAAAATNSPTDVLYRLKEGTWTTKRS